MSQETISLIIIAFVTLSFAQLSKHKDSSTVLIPSRPSQQKEIEVTRWRHDGTQPVFWTKGDAAHFDDPTVVGLQPKIG